MQLTGVFLGLFADLSKGTEAEIEDRIGTRFCDLLRLSPEGKPVSQPGLKMSTIISRFQIREDPSRALKNSRAACPLLLNKNQPSRSTQGQASCSQTASVHLRLGSRRKVNLGILGAASLPKDVPFGHGRIDLSRQD